MYEFVLLHNHMGNVRIQLCVFLQPLGFKVPCSILFIRRCFCCAVEVRKFLVKFLHLAQMNRNVYLKLATWASCCLVSELFTYIHTVWKITSFIAQYFQRKFFSHMHYTACEVISVVSSAYASFI